MQHRPAILSWTERNKVIGAGRACEQASFIIISITIRLRTLPLENLRVRRRLARLRTSIRAGAAILRLVESKAGALTPDHATPSVPHRQFIRAPAIIDIDRANRGGTTAAQWSHGYGEVEAIDEAQVVKIFVAVAVESEFNQRYGRGTAGSVACNLT